MGYYDILRQAVSPGGEKMTLCTKSGMTPWPEVEAAMMLLIQEANVRPGMRVLILEGGAGALAVWAASRKAEAHTYDHSLVAARMARATVQVNKVTGVTIHEAAFPAADEREFFDVALLIVPKGRDYSRALLSAAYRALKPGAPLYLAGANTGGIKTAIPDAGDLFGRAAMIRFKARSRVAIATKEARGSNAPKISPDDPTWSGEPRPFDARGLKLFGAPSIFSADAVDPGTAMLLATLDESLCKGTHVLDVGCGYGVIGLYAASLGARADLIDSNWLALDCARRGVEANRLENAQVWASDIYSDVKDRAYDLILSNPPFHAGRGVDTDVTGELIAGARERLKTGGCLRLVANRFLPYDRAMQAAFGEDQVSTVAEDRRYRVLEARR